MVVGDAIKIFSGFIKRDRKKPKEDNNKLIHWSKT